MDKNLKLILGLIWTLILHYQISIGFGIGDDKGNDGPTPKQALMNYLQVLILLTFCTLRPTSSGWCRSGSVLLLSFACVVELQSIGSSLASLPLASQPQ